MVGAVVDTGESFSDADEEFENVTTTHMHCPNCMSEIAQVIVRQKVVSHEPTITIPPFDLLGCFSCLNFFTCSDKGCLISFDFPPKDNNLASPSSDEQKAVLIRNESCFTMFWVFEKEKHNLKPHPVIMSDQVQSQLATATAEGLCRLPSFGHVFPSLASEHDDNIINIDEKQGISRVPSFDVVRGFGPFCIFRDIDLQGEIQIPESRERRSWFGYKGLHVDILKSVIYGGLREVIASSGVVAFASAYFAHSSSVIALAVACLIGGVFVIGHNLWDLRDDHYNDYLRDFNYEEPTNKYEELLGQVNNFPLHAFFAILSFVMFGMVPPVAYTLSFHTTNDKDSKLVVVAIVSLLCVLLLTTSKAYINRYTICKSIGLVMCYATMVVIMSSASYAAGHLLTSLMEKIGLFDTSSNGGISLLPNGVSPTLASF